MIAARVRGPLAWILLVLATSAFVLSAEGARRPRVKQRHRPSTSQEEPAAPTSNDRGSETDAPADRGGKAPLSSAPPDSQHAISFPSVSPRTLTAEEGLDSVRVRYGDGRPAESVPVLRANEGAYLRLADMGRIFGGYRWDPETYRGDLRVDSLGVDFVLDTPILWVRGSSVQIPTPVRYAAESPCLPLCLIDVVAQPLLGARCRWDPSTGRLDLAGRAPYLATADLNSGGAVATLTLFPVDPKLVRIRWDPLGLLRVEVKGTHLSLALPKESICLMRVSRF